MAFIAVVTVTDDYIARQKQYRCFYEVPQQWFA